MLVTTHPPGVSHPSANKVGVVDDVVMSQGGPLWNPSCALVMTIRINYSIYNNGIIKMV